MAVFPPFAPPLEPGSSTIVVFSILTACYKARTRSAPDYKYNHKPVGRVPVLRPFEPYWENEGPNLGFPVQMVARPGLCQPVYGCSQEHYASSPCNMLSKSKNMLTTKQGFCIYYNSCTTPGLELSIVSSHIIRVQTLRFERYAYNSPDHCMHVVT